MIITYIIFLLLSEKSLKNLTCEFNLNHVLNGTHPSTCATSSVKMLDA